MENPVHSYGVSPAIWDHLVFAACQAMQVNALCLNPSQTAGTQFAYPE